MPPNYAVLVRSQQALPPDYAVAVRQQQALPPDYTVLAQIADLPPSYEVLVRPIRPESEEGPISDQ